MFLPTTIGLEPENSFKNSSDQQTVSMIEKEIEIPAGSDYYIKFLSENSTLEEKDLDFYSKGLSEKAIAAIAKSPNWIQRELTRQFLSLNNSEDHVNLILNSSKKYTDEIAFSIAYSPLNCVPSVEILRDNVVFLYENDKWINYADIVDYDQGNGDYYSTVKYRIIENGTEKLFEYPKEIYYWFIVHPKISGETPEYIYGKFWREYLFYHNDLGYPLLKEKLSTIEYLWDGQSYHQQKDRLWTPCINNHPTAIEAISYWIGKTVPAQAIGDRPPQPNIIAHEHNGWCGELQKIAIAAQRAALIPSIGAYNLGEDHVWREFFERGWHQNDNWWTDSGGTVDIPDVYEYGWGKNMSSVYNRRGDDTIYETTHRYIHPSDRYKVKFVIRDMYLNPIDGARVTVLVRGIKDITWYKNKIWEIIENLWDKIPNLLKGKILEYLYEKIDEKFDNIPDTINGLTLSTWNYTNNKGECTLDLGRGHSYLFIVQQGKLKNYWQLAVNNAIRFLNEPKNTTFNILFANPFNKIQRHKNKELPVGNCRFNINFTAESYQLQKNIWGGDVGYYSDRGNIDFFIVDEENFEKYKNGKKFVCYEYFESKGSILDFNTNKANWYFVFRNQARRTNIVLDFSASVETVKDNFLEIVCPDTNIFENPVFNVGDIINISGITSGEVIIWGSYQGKRIEITGISTGEEWFVNWNTSGCLPGEYVIHATSNRLSDNISITLQDELPPTIIINYPSEDMIIEENTINISGISQDTFGIDKVEVAIDNDEFRNVNGIIEWFIEYDISEFDLGEHIIHAKATDSTGKESVNTITFYLNESGYSWKPQINSINHRPENPTNTSNIIIYANVTSTSPFKIDKVLLFCDNGKNITSQIMFRYGNNPIQERHEEDPLFNQSNDPTYGYELGQFSNNEIINYWIIAFDKANNSKKSSVKSFFIGS